MPDQNDVIDSSGSPSGICTLFEGDYHFGLAALLNSLVQAGYAGTIWAGYRGALPPWLHQLQRSAGTENEYLVAGKIRLVLLAQATSGSILTNYKPDFMLELLAGPAKACDYLWYFDPDIFIRVPWTFFAGWQQCGVALCQEIVNNILPEEFALAISVVRDRLIHRAQQSPPAQSVFEWRNGRRGGFSRGLSSSVEAPHPTRGRDGLRFESLYAWSSRVMPFHASDQDALNIAAMYSEFPLSILGPQGMGFTRGDVKMYHTVGQKPWRGSFLLRALAATPPTERHEVLFDAGFVADTGVLFAAPGRQAPRLFHRRIHWPLLQ